MGQKLLVVDDQIGIRLLLKEVLEKDGYETFEASNGQAALDMIQSEKPDLVLLDMKIPGMDGIEILREMRARSIPTEVFMMTAYGEMELMREAADLGASQQFSKPFDIDIVRQSVRRFFEEKAKL
ncbi:response regulator [Alkalicoccus luteus]|uniref:Response regulator n=1 Tax=Alkalicoccus luteus TaxID=1237094 RepID=A0A969PNA9_9BACI|nr:response regulator [Alkalicoccus luteus]NJP37362.1 response regulator [Alkalicoccus luteus]